MANQILDIAPYWLDSVGTWVFGDDPFDADVLVLGEHIHKRFPEVVVASIIEKLQTQIEELQERLAEYEQVEK